MSNFKTARYKDGSQYSGHKQYLGGGVQRSCGKCGQFSHPAGFRKMGAYGLCCAKCRGEK